MNVLVRCERTHINIHIYTKYLDSLTPYHTYPEIWTSPFYYVQTCLKSAWLNGKQCSSICVIWSDLYVQIRFVLSLSLGKMLFAWRFIIMIFFWVDHIKSICLFLKLSLWPKNWSDLCNFYKKVMFWIFLSKKIVFTFLYFFLMIDVSWKYCEKNIISGGKQNFLTFVHKLHSGQTSITMNIKCNGQIDRLVWSFYNRQVYQILRVLSLMCIECVFSLKVITLYFFQISTDRQTDR